MIITEQIRQAIRDCGMTRYRISKESGVSQSTLSKFMAGKGMRCDMIDRIAPVLGLRITTSPPTIARTPKAAQRGGKRPAKAGKKGGAR